MSDLISRQAAIDICRAPHMRNADCSDFEMAIMMLPPAQPAPSQVAKDIARIVENGQDMRVIQPEIIYCKDCKKQNKDYHMSPYKDTVCPLTAWRGTAQGHEYDYQFCCFAERRDVTT